MLRRSATFVMLVGRIATFALGSVVLVGLALGPVSLGLAAAGDPLLAGKANNAATKITSLVANLTGPVLRLTNQGAGPALELRVQGGPPLRVNSEAVVANLNADKLDGLDSTQFVRQGATAYEVDQGLTAPANDQQLANVFCDEGDLLQAGGYFALSANGVITQNAPSNGSSGWRVVLRSTTAQSSSVTVRILCIDLPPLRG